MPPKNRYKLTEILSPEAKETLRHFELHARRVVQGLLHGIHRSRRLGVSTDFDHHKLYQPGDPLKHIDWKVSARHDSRVFVKRYHEDTAMAVRVVVDRSASMLRETEELPSKYLQAARIAASLAYLSLGDRDSVGVVTTAADETFWLPVSSSGTQLVRILEALVSKEPASEDGVADTLRALVDRQERRGLVVLVSDLMYDPEPVQRELGRLAAQGQELMILNMRDPVEEEFPFNRWVEFIDLESGGRHRLDTVPLKRFYREEYQNLMEDWKSWTRKYDCHLISFQTGEATETVLSEYLARRAMGGTWA
jgi:uncharacterized protein (DUF58 family)